MNTKLRKDMSNRELIKTMIDSVGFLINRPDIEGDNRLMVNIISMSVKELDNRFPK